MRDTESTHCIIDKAIDFSLFCEAKRLGILLKSFMKQSRLNLMDFEKTL